MANPEGTSTCGTPDTNGKYADGAQCVFTCDDPGYHAVGANIRPTATAGGDPNNFPIVSTTCKAGSWQPAIQCGELVVGFFTDLETLDSYPTCHVPFYLHTCAACACEPPTSEEAAPLLEVGFGGNPGELDCRSYGVDSMPTYYLSGQSCYFGECRVLHYGPPGAAPQNVLCNDGFWNPAPECVYNGKLLERPQ